MKTSLFWAALFGMCITNDATAQVVPTGKCALIVASRKTTYEVKEYIAGLRDNRYATAYLASNGWYAISIGTLEEHQIAPIMRDWKNTGKIPPDSRCSYGKTYKYEIDWRTGARKPPLGNSTQSNADRRSQKRLDCHKIDYRQELAACYITVLGPKVCSEYISANRIPGADTYAERVSIASICTSSINASYAKQTIPADLIMTAFDEWLETGCDKINSDNIFAKYLVGPAHCIANLARWEQKVNAANRCARELELACPK